MTLRGLTLTLFALTLVAASAASASERQLICRAGGPASAIMQWEGAGLPRLAISISGDPYDTLERLPDGHCVINGQGGLDPSHPRLILLDAEGPVTRPPSAPGALDAKVARDAAFQALMELFASGQDGWFAAVATAEGDAWRARRAFPCDSDGCR